MKINKQFVRDYFKKWTNGKLSKDSQCLFVQMLQGKVIAARRTNNKMFCFDKTYDDKQIEKMLCIADDINLY